MEGFENTEQDISKLLGFGGFGSTKVIPYFVFRILYSVVVFLFDLLLYTVFVAFWRYSWLIVLHCNVLYLLYFIVLHSYGTISFDVSVKAIVSIHDICVRNLRWYGLYQFHFLWILLQCLELFCIERNQHFLLVVQVSNTLITSP